MRLNNNKPIKNRKAVWSEPYFDEGAGNIKMVTYSLPVYKNGEIIAVATMDVALEPFSKLLYNKLTEYKSFGFIIISSTGQFIYHPSKERIIRDNIFTLKDSDIDPAQEKEIGKKMIAGESGTMVLDDRIENVKRLAFYAPIKATGWSISASLNEDDAYANLDNLLLTITYTNIIAFILFVAGIVIFSSKISKPLRKLRHVIAKIMKQLRKQNQMMNLGIY